MTFDTIIAAPFESRQAMRAMVVDRDEATVWDEDEPRERLFRIRAADSDGHRSSASILVNRRYAWRGYHSDWIPEPECDRRITLVAVDHDETIGTITIGFDSPEGLLVDDIFFDYVAQLRHAGRRICEFTKLAMDSLVRSKRVLASLFHVAYIYAHRLKTYDCLLIEVNPRHVLFYERMLGFKAIGPERLNRRVNAPAVLMCLDFAHASEQINALGGTADTKTAERSLYPFFFSVKEEAGIVGRLRSFAKQAQLV